MRQGYIKLESKWQSTICKKRAKRKFAMFKLGPQQWYYNWTDKTSWIRFCFCKVPSRPLIALSKIKQSYYVNIVDVDRIRHATKHYLTLSDSTKRLNLQVLLFILIHYLRWMRYPITRQDWQVWSRRILQLDLYKQLALSLLLAPPLHCQSHSCRSWQSINLENKKNLWEEMITSTEGSCIKPGN